MDASALDTVVEIETPEHLAFRTRLAGPGRRLLAWLLDSLVWLALLAVLQAVASLVGAAGLLGYDSGVMLLGLFFLWWGYFFVSELATGGRSVGKMALKLRVVQDNGLPVTWRGSLLRNLLRAVDISLVPPMILLLGPLVMAADARFRRVGDLVGGTFVIVEEPTRVEPPPEHRPDPAEVAALPAILPIPRDEREALELFASRERIGPARRDELARMVAPLLAERLALPPPKDATQFLLALWERLNQGPHRAGGRP